MTANVATPGEANGSVLAQWMSVSDANPAGNVHGGMVMKLCDEAAALAAIRYSGRQVVTAAIDSMTFLVPIKVGDLVTLRASVNAAWRTSMEVGVRVEAEDPRTGLVTHTNSAYLTLVAVDERGRPVPIPALDALTADAARRASEAQLRRQNRLAEREMLRSARAAEGGGHEGTTVDQPPIRPGT